MIKTTKEDLEKWELALDITKKILNDEPVNWQYESPTYGWCTAKDYTPLDLLSKGAAANIRIVKPKYQPLAQEDYKLGEMLLSLNNASIYWVQDIFANGLRLVSGADGYKQAYEYEHIASSFKRIVDNKWVPCQKEVV